LVSKYTPRFTEAITGVPAASIVRAAEIWGPAETSMLLHARGVEHHSKGVENCLSYISLVLASGRIGKPGSGYGTITVRAMVRVGVNMDNAATSCRARGTSRILNTGSSLRIFGALQNPNCPGRV
jgi:assimilatory nitrate reductase catalytic subunit